MELNLEGMPYIKNKKVFKAVCYARVLTREKRLNIALAMHKAAKYYDVSIHEVAKYMGKFASNRRDGIESGKEANF